ncbi:MAG: adenosine deaminase [Pseudomonadota bacterium]
MNWRDFPKLELHLHLEGAAPPPLVQRMGAEQGVDLEGLFNADGGYNSNDFTSFLAAYEKMSRVFTKPEHYKALTEAVLAECHAHGVLYAEIFLSPTSMGYTPAEWLETLAAIEEGADAAEAEHGVLCRFIPVAVRHHGPEKALEAAEVAISAPRGRMRGFGIAGDERVHAPVEFAPAFAMMKEAGFRLTAHAGEFGGPESVRAALDDLWIERVGHGVRSAEDPELVKRLADEGVTLETCPGSNVALGVYQALADHPVASLAEAGVNVTISTDDPPFFHTTMTREYETLEETFGFGQGDYAGFARNALAAAFCEDEVKAKLGAALDKAQASGAH